MRGAGGGPGDLDDWSAPLKQALAQIPMTRMREPAEAAAAVLWLLSAEASYVTGATLDVAGGM